MDIFNFEQMVISLKKLVPYISYTLLVVITAMIFGIIVGFVLAYAKLSKHKVVKKIAYFITSIIRGTPFLVLLFVVFYGLPVLLEMFGIVVAGMPKLIYMLVTLSLFNGSRLSEVFRSAYESVDKTQMEAALSSGLTEFQGIVRIVLPQAFYIALPNLGNAFMGALMETSLGYTIGLLDIMGKAKLLNSLSNGAYTMEIYVSVAIIYWILSLCIDFIFNTVQNLYGKPYSIKQIDVRKEIEIDGV